MFRSLFFLLSKCAENVSKEKSYFDLINLRKNSEDNYQDSMIGEDKDVFNLESKECFEETELNKNEKRNKQDDSENDYEDTNENMNKRVKVSSQEDISQTCQETPNLPSDTNLHDSSTCSDNLFTSNSSSEESVLHVKNIFIEDFIQDSLFIPNKNDIKTKTTNSINKLKKEVLKNDIFSLNYQLIMETIRKEYEYHAKTPESNYDDWLFKNKEHFNSFDEQIHGLSNVIILKEKLIKAYGYNLSKNNLCFLNVTEFFNQRFEKLSLLTKILDNNENSVLHLITFMKSIDLKKCKNLSFNNIFELLNSDLNIFVDFFLPEWFNLKKIILTKKFGNNQGLSKKIYSVLFFIYRSIISYRKFVFIFSIKDICMEKYYKLFFCRIFVNEMVQLRSLLIYVCNQRNLIAAAKILNSMNKMHLKFMSYEKPTEKQINQFWLVYGCLLVHKKFDSFDKWKEFLNNNISKLNPNDCIDWNNVNQNQIPGGSLLADLRNLTQKYDPLQLENNLEVWQQKGFLFNSENLTNIPGIVKNIINQRIQNTLIAILQFKKIK